MAPSPQINRQVSKNSRFQILGPQTEKARFPNWVRNFMTTAALVVQERRWQRPDSSLLNLMILLMYAGPRWLRMVAILSCYRHSADYASQAHALEELSISEVTGDWHDSMILQRIMWKSSACSRISSKQQWSRSAAFFRDYAYSIHRLVYVPVFART